MGWTSYRATKYKKDGTVDKKAELDAYWLEDRHELLKSAMVGSTYYAAVRVKDTGEVFAAVFLTESRREHGHNFAYKPMSESCGPTEAKCPKGILALLTEADNDYAAEWRDKCRQYHANKELFEKLPLGTKIIWTVPHEYFTHFKKGQKVELVKRKLGERLTAWVTSPGCVRLNAKYIDIKDIVIIEP